MHDQEIIPEVKEKGGNVSKELGQDWILKTEKGRQRWFPKDEGIAKAVNQKNQSSVFTFNKSRNPNSADLVYRNQKLAGLPPVLTPEWMDEPLNFCDSRVQKAYKSAYKGIHFYTRLQSDEGHWPGDYGGPLFLLPSLVITSYLTETPFSEEKKALMTRYMLNHQNTDGGWGLHIEGNSTMFGTVLQYCALRILGLASDNSQIFKARKWILEHGGATGTPSWGKFFLAILGVYEWNGCHSLLPELWLFPKWLPVHPWRYWCHARMVYLPMSYCFGKKIKVSSTLLIEELKSEIYSQEYSEINWKKTRDTICLADRFKPASIGLKALFTLLNAYEKIAFRFLRRKANAYVLEYVNAEDEQTNYINIGPVNQIINSICAWDAYGKNSEAFKKHVQRWDDYLWLAEDGLKMNGYNGSQLWDTALAVQAISENLPENQCEKALARAYSFIDYTQIKQEVSKAGKYFRHPSVGGWPFSTRDHGWPISDCTAEGVKAVLAMHGNNIPEFNDLPKISMERIRKAVDLILTLQNEGGGWGTYENTRGGLWLEYLNPSEVFGKIMVDYPWVECTSACVTALVAFNNSDPDYRKKEITTAVESGLSFIKSNQNPDGSWVGNWGVCFTYGTWFAIEALAKSGAQTYGEGKEACLEIEKACKFLVSKQNADGGWGESYLSCVKGEYCPHKESQIVNTSWALLALMEANYPDKNVIDRGIDFLISKQEENGDWPQGAISGVFNQNCMITYTSYRNIFPIWTIGKYTRSYFKKLRYRGNSTH